MTPESEAESAVAEAAATPKLNRVPEHLGRLVRLGSPVVAPLIRRYREDPGLISLVTATLRELARAGLGDAWNGLEELAATTADRDAVKEFRTALLSISAGPRRGGNPDPFAWGFAARSERHRAVLERIDSTRLRRGEPALTPRQREQVQESLELRARDPAHYRNVCWNCHAVVTEAHNVRCRACGWLSCWCGACREPTRPWPPNGSVGPCAAEGGVLGHELSYPDTDFLGRSILTAYPLSADAPQVRQILAQHGITSVLHWSNVSRIASVLERGLLSRNELQLLGVDHTLHGYSSLEKRYAAEPYVGVTFKPTPRTMRAWSPYPVVYEIDLAAASAAGTVFLTSEASPVDVTPDALAKRTGPDALQASLSAAAMNDRVVAEAWVRQRIPRQALVRAIVASPKVLAAIQREVQAKRPTMTLEVDVDPGLFEL